MQISQNLNDLLKQSSVPIETQKRLIVAAQAGTNVAAQLSDWIDLGYFQNTIPIWLETWLKLVQPISEALVGGNDKDLARDIDVLVSSRVLPSDRRYLPVLLDVHTALLSRQDGGWKESFPKLRSLLVAVFQNLSDTQLKIIVEYDVVALAGQITDFVAKWRWLYYVASPIYDNGVWAAQFLPLLKKNQELLGDKITFADKELAPTVENWLKEYDAFSGKPGPQRQALDRLHFIQNSSNVKALSKEDQAVLLKLCELYDWFSDPYVTEAEVAEFEDISPATSRPGLVREVAVSAPVKLEKVPSAESDREALNVQGVLVKTPLGVSKSGLEVSGQGEHSDPVADSGASGLPVSAMVQEKSTVPVAPKQKPLSQIAVPKPAAQSAEQVALVKKVPANLPTLATPPTAKKIAPLPKAAPLDMEAIKAEAEKKKQLVQADIDKKLQKFKGQQ